MIVGTTQSNILASLRSFLLAVLPADVEVIAGQTNRVAEPSKPRFIVMSPPNFARLATNIDSWDDVRFTGSIAGNLMTVTAVAFGTIRRGATVFGTGVAAETVIAAVGGTGTGGPGTYSVSGSQTVASRMLAAGQQNLVQPSQVSIQLDFHAADGTSGDLAQTVSTVLRDGFGVQQFADQSPNYGVSPLYADDPRQMPFHNAEQQVEWRWILEVALQVDQSVAVPQQYSDAVAVDVVSVDAAYPP